MKLWQKISLIALVLVTLAVQLTQFYILDSHFSQCHSPRGQLRRFRTFGIGGFAFQPRGV